MSADRFLAHLNEEESRFICYAAGEDSPERLEVSVIHSLGSPAKDEQLAKLRKLLGPNAGQVEALYSKHDGFGLYEQSAWHAGLVLYPIDHWEAATQRFKDELGNLERSLDDAFQFEQHGLVFGAPAFSGNYFFLYNGAIYYSDHDGGDDTPLAASFNEFLDRIVNDPARFLFDIGCYARYSDERTDLQWIPERYVSRDRTA
jgi:hypothetical protein